MDASLSITLLVILTVIAGIGGQVLAAWVKVPSIVFLLLFGIVLGRDGLGWILPGQLGVGLDVLVSLSVALILFEGGLNLELRELGRVSGSLRNLITIGVGVTLLGGATAAHWLSEFPWPLAFLYAAIVVVTGPTVTVPLLQQVKVDREVSALIEGEGVLIDPLGAILAVVVLDIILNEAPTPGAILSGLGLRLGTGLVIGLAGGGLLGFFLKRVTFLSEELKNLLVLAGAWGIFGLAQSLRSESGLMASVTSGIVLGASSIPGERLLRRFKGQLTVLAISVLFILLAADLSIASVFALGWGGLLTVLALMFIVRPIEIVLCTIQSGLNWRQKFFLSWIAPRGIVSASVASLFSLLLTARGINGGDSIKALVFLTILLTVFLQGLSAKSVANLLKITADGGTGTVLVGSNPLSRLVARLIQDGGSAVTIIDTEEQALSKAQAQNIPTFLTSAFDAEALDEAGMAEVSTVLVATSNSDVNQAIAQRIVEEFNPPKTLVASPNASGTSESLNPKIQLAFDPELSVKNWNKYLTEGAVQLGETLLQDEDFERQKAHLNGFMRRREMMPLFLERDGNRRLFTREDSWKVGDRLLYLFHSPISEEDAELADETVKKKRKKLVLTFLPQVDNIPDEPEPEAADEASAKPLGQQLLEKLPVIKKVAAGGSADAPLADDSEPELDIAIAADSAQVDDSERSDAMPVPEVSEAVAPVEPELPNSAAISTIEEEPAAVSDSSVEQVSRGELSEAAVVAKELSQQATSSGMAPLSKSDVLEPEDDEEAEAQLAESSDRDLTVPPPGALKPPTPEVKVAVAEEVSMAEPPTPATETSIEPAASEAESPPWPGDGGSESAFNKNA